MDGTFLVLLSPNAMVILLEALQLLFQLEKTNSPHLHSLHLSKPNKTT